MSSAIERERTRLPDGHRDRHARRLRVSGQKMAGDGSDKNGSRI